MPIDGAERERRRALLAAHYESENEHDLDGIMQTFSTTGEMIYNGQAFGDPESIRLGHTYIGFSSAQGAFSDVHVTRDREHVTDDEIVVEGRLQGIHRAEFQGFAPTQRTVELPFIAFYRFASDGKLVSERVVMNLGPLGQQPL
jgi:hypothetical protein